MHHAQAELDSAFEAASRILNDIGMGACPFTIEPEAGMSALRLKRPGALGDVTISVPIDQHHLAESLDDQEIRTRLRHEWMVKLAPWRDAILRDPSLP